MAVAFQRHHQQSEIVWPQSGQVCCRSPSCQSLKTAVHFGQRTGGVLTGTVDGAGLASRTQILLAFGSCQRTEELPCSSRTWTSWPRLIRVISSGRASGWRPSEDSTVGKVHAHPPDGDSVGAVAVFVERELKLLVPIEEEAGMALVPLPLLR